jgi:hypothetical protein
MVFIPQPGIKNIVHTQSTASDTWTITHDFPNSPTFAVETAIDVNGTLNIVIPKDIYFPDANTIVIKWSKPRTGTARLC